LDNPIFKADAQKIFDKYMALLQNGGVENLPGVEPLGDH